VRVTRINGEIPLSDKDDAPTECTQIEMWQRAGAVLRLITPFKFEADRRV